MGLTREQVATVDAFKPFVDDLLKKMMKPSALHSLSAEGRFFRGRDCKATTTVQDGGGDNRYRLFVKLTNLSDGRSVTFLDKAEERILLAELKKVAEAAGWRVVMGANLEQGMFGYLVTPRG